MSVFFLSLTGSQSKSMGTLEIDYTVWPGGEVSMNWEWMGGPRGSDGGTWTWKDGQTDPGRGAISMVLVSNLTGGIIGHVFESNWDKGPMPPTQPWFSQKGGAIDKLFRYSASSDGIIYFFFWELKK